LRIAFFSEIERLEKDVLIVSKIREYKSEKKVKNRVQEEIENRDQALVLFYASWCPFSRRFLPIFQEYSENNPLECMSVAVDDLPDLCEEYSIEYYPTVILFSKGEICRRLDAKPGIGLNEKEFKNLVSRK
jgi:thiol-disulfide isomerase/thioredoxin